jgi:hypothetical protein
LEVEEIMSQSPMSAVDRAELLLQKLKPNVVAALEKMSPHQVGLSFDQIEAQSASVGDLLSRILLCDAVGQQPSASDLEIAAAKQTALQHAGPRAKKLRAEQLKMTRIPDKPCSVATVRGAVPLTREYLYFPELKTGIFPP